MKQATLKEQLVDFLEALDCDDLRQLESGAITSEYAVDRYLGEMMPELDKDSICCPLCGKH